MTFVRRVLVLSVLALLCLGVPAMGADGEALQAGVAKVDITPQEPVRLAGYASRTELSQGVHDPLSLRVVLLREGAEELALVSAENLGFYGETAAFTLNAVASEAGIPGDRIFLTAIHTHSAPWLTLDNEKDPPANVRYTHFLKDQIVKAIGLARGNLQPVQLALGRGDSEVGVNRREELPDGSVTLGRNPQGVHDTEVLVLGLQKPDGSSLGCIYNYATHATSLGAANMQVSGDLIGIASNLVEGWHDQVPAMALVGASGDIDPWYRVLPGFRSGDGWISETELLGRMLAVDVVHALEAMQPIEGRPVIATATTTLTVPGKPRGETISSSGDSAPAVQLPITAARIGDIGLLGIGGEVFTEIGWAIKRGSPFPHTLVITHCNGSKGYLPPAHVYKEGGYEVESSPFGPAAADQVVKEALRLLYSLAASKP